MKKNLFIAILLFSVSKISAQNIPTDIFLFLGQSNMAGTSPIGLLDTVTLENVYLFNSNDNWEKAKNTLTQGTNRYSTVRTNTNTLSPAYTFTRKLADYTGRKIGIVSNARSATAISWWQKGYEGENDNDLYEEAVARAKAALLATPGATIKGILWLQGESDNSSGGPLYSGRLQQLVNDLRTDLGDNTIPFIAGEIGKWRGRGLGVNPVIRSIKEYLEYTDWVSSDGLTSIDLANNDPHFDNLSQRTYGGRFADKALELIYNYTLDGVTVFSGNNYEGRSLLLGEGDYSSTELESMGVLINEIASLKTHIGYEIQFLSGSGSVSSVIADDTPVLDNITAASVRIIKKQAVPVSLTSFTAQKQNNAVKLNWVTVSEQNNSHFEVQRSADGVNFSTIGSVAGKGTVNEVNNYSFTDTSPLQEITYYQLKQVDFNGNSELSNILSVNNSFSEKNLHAYVSDSGNVVISYVSASESSASVEILNIAGKKVAAQTVNLQKGENRIEIPVNLTNNGVYIARLTNKNIQTSVKFLK